MVSSTVFSSTWQGTLTKEKVQQAEVWGYFTLNNANFINVLFFFSSTVVQYLTTPILQNLVGLFFPETSFRKIPRTTKKRN